MEFPFKIGDTVLELAGGEFPLFHPNLDVRPMPAVDIVCNLENSLPVPSESFDGIYCRFFLEHLSWRKIRSFLSEVFRVLRVGGCAFFITANTLEQCKRAISQKWSDETSCTLFGDQNYSGGQWVHNAHHCGFSPEYAIKLFREAGFYEVRVESLPECDTDMFIIAKKSESVIVW